jgi:phospholipid/cholesterol/gamma-HCH transport system ATP-binding protein
MIELVNLHKRFGAKEVLRGVSFRIPEGTTTCIIGKSGCGKSVLLKHIVGLLKPDRGAVQFGGVRVDSLSQSDLFSMRQQVGYVFQGAALFDSMTVFENVVISLVERGGMAEEQLHSEAKRVLSAVGLLPSEQHVDLDVFENEYAILSTKKPSDLSGGMRKRVGVARALVGKPRYVFYDEPTTGLDPITSQQIDDLVATLASSLDVTSVVITHDMFSVFNIASHVVMLDSGLVRFQGSVAELQQSTDTVVQDFLERFVHRSL